MTLELKDLYSGYRDPKKLLYLKDAIAKQSKGIEKLNIMEVCGGHTHAIMKYGLPQLLPQSINFVHGPGCPVCVMPKLRVDEAIALAKMDGSILVTLGDMIKVLGSEQTLQDVRAKGADVRFVYSPLEALKIAQQNSDKKVIFVAIGFETTTPMSASLFKQMLQKGVKNLYFHVNHVVVPPAMEAILSQPNSIDAFIGPSHVSVISGSKIYEPFAHEHGRPVVVGGFEPVDVMESVLEIIKQIKEGKSEVDIQYSRSVNREGNVKAQRMIEHYFRPIDFEFRGLGVVKNGGLGLKKEYVAYDARVVFEQFLPKSASDEDKNCLCAQILTAKALPSECKLFGSVCTPAKPVGSCMVSSEGACAAYFKYGVS